MPTYQIDGPDGKTYRIDGPAGATEEQIINAIQQRLAVESPEVVSPPSVPDPYTDLEAFKSSVLAELGQTQPQKQPQDDSAFTGGVKTGIDIVQEATGSTLEGIGRITGAEGLEEYGAEVAERNRLEAQTRAKGEGALGYYAQVLGEQVPQLAIGAAGLGIAALAAPVAAVGAVPAFLIAAGAAALTQIPLFYGLNRQRQKEAIDQGIKTEVNESAAFFWSIPQAALEGIADKLLFGKFITPKMLRGGGLFTRAAKGVGVGAVAEVPTEIGQQVIERFQAGLDLFSDEAISEYVEAGRAAALVGGTVRGATNVLQGDATIEDKDVDDLKIRNPKRKKALEKLETEGDPSEGLTAIQDAIDTGKTPEELKFEAEEAAIDKIFFPEEGDIDGTKEGTSGVGVSDDPKSAIVKKTATGPVSAEGTGTSGTAGVAADQPDVRRVDDRKVGDDSALAPEEISPIPYSELSREEKAEYTKTPLSQQKAKLIEIAERRAKITEPEPTQVDTTPEQVKVNALSPEETVVAYVNNEKIGRENVVKKIQESPELSKRATTGLPEGDTIPVYRFIKYNEKTKPKQEELISGSLTPEGSAAFIKLATQSNIDVSKNRISDVQRVIRYDVPREDIKAYLPALADSLEQKHNKKVKGVGIGKALQFSKKIENPVDNAKNLIEEQGEVFADVSKLKGKVLKYGDTGKAVDFNRSASSIINKIRDGEVKTTEDFNKLGSDILRLPIGSTRQQETKARQDLINEVRSFYNLDQKKTTEKKEPVVTSVYPKPLKSLLKETQVVPAAVKGKKKIITKEKPVALAESVQEVDARTRTSEQVKTTEDTNKTAKKIISAVEGVQVGAIDARIKERKTKQKTDSIIARAEQFANAPETTPRIKTLKEYTRKYGDDMEGLGTPVQKSRLIQKRIDRLDKDIETQTKEVAENKELTNEDRTRMRVLKVNRNELKKQLEFERKEAETQEADPLSAQDIDKVTQFIGKKLPERVPSKDPKKKSDVNYDKKVQEFFSRTPSVLERLLAAAQDIALSPPTINTTKNGVSLYEDLELEIYRGTGSNLGKQVQEWVNKNLSKEVQTWFESAVKSYGAGDIKTSTYMERREAKEKEAADLAEQIATQYDDAAIEAARKQGRRLFGQKLDLLIDEVTGIDTPLHSMVSRALSSGNLKNTLLAIGATNKNKRVARIAETLSTVVGTTKFEIVENLSTAGSFDPKTNTIKLNANYGLNTHTILHEMTHAAVSAELKNKSSQTTKALIKQYNYIKKNIDSEYGTTSLDEFISEIFSNPDFQARVAQVIDQKESVVTTALDRVKHIIDNLLRVIGRTAQISNRPTIPWAEYKTDRLINSLLAPAPKFRDAGELYMASPKKAKQEFDDATPELVEVTPEESSKTLDNLMTQRVPRTVKSSWLGLWSLNMLTDTRMVRKYIPMANKLNVIARKQAGEYDVLTNSIDLTVKELTRWGRGNTKAMAKIIRMQIRATTNQVDPSKPRAAYISTSTNKVKDSKEKLKVWDDMKDTWDSLSTQIIVRSKLGNVTYSGQDVYNIMKNVNIESFNRVKDLFLDRVKTEVGPNGEEIQKRVSKLYKKLIEESGIIDPYFSFQRKGSYWLSYNGKDPLSDNKNERFVHLFESAAERAKAAKLLEANGFKPENFERDNISEKYREAPPGSFVNEVLSVLQKENVNDDIQNKLVQLFLDALPEQSVLQAFRSREGVRGFINDTTPLSELQGVKDASVVEAGIAGFRDKAKSMARQYTQIKYAAEVQKVTNEIDKHVKATVPKSSDKARISENIYILRDELALRAKFMKDPYVENWAKVATSVGFAFTLGGNVSGAVVNLSQVPLIVVPQLAPDYGGVGRVTAAVGRASRVFTRSAGSRRTVAIMGPDGKYKDKNVEGGFSIDNLDYSAEENKDVAHLGVAVQHWRKMGVLNRTIAGDVLDYESPPDVKYIPIEFINKLTGFFLHHTERYNRQTTLMTVLELDLAKKLKIDPAKLGEAFAKNKISNKMIRDSAETSVELTELTNGSNLATTAPRYAQRGFGKVAFLFKRFGMSMMYILGKNLDDSLRGQSKEVRSAARKKLAGIYGSAAILAGAQGVPLFGTLATFMNTFFRDDDEDDFETSVRKYLKEGMYGGLPNAMFGIDVSTRIGLSNLLFRKNLYQNNSPLIYQAIMAVGGPVVGVADSFVRGAVDFGSGLSGGDGDMRRGVESMLPAAIRNGLKAYRWSDFSEGTALTRRGDKIVEDISAGGLLAQLLGFAPANYSRQLQESAQLKKIDRAIQQKRASIYKKIYAAIRMRNTEDLRDMGKELREFNKKYPEFAISTKGIISSVKSNMKTSMGAHHGVILNEATKRRLQISGEDWGPPANVFGSTLDTVFKPYEEN